MCFLPRRRALFWHRSVQKKWSEGGLFCALWLRNMPRISTACSFSTSQLQKLAEIVSFLHFWLGHLLRATTACNCSSLIWPAGSAPAPLASLLFDPWEPQNIGRAQCFATCLPFRAPASSFFSLSLTCSFSILTFSSDLLLYISSVHLVGSLTSKLPSMICVMNQCRQ